MTLAKSSFFDEESLLKAYSFPQFPGRMRFYVKGVKCARCVQKIESLKEGLNQVEDLQVNLGTHEMTVQLKAGQHGFSGVVEAVEKIGFEIEPIRTLEDLTEQTKKEDLLEVRRLGVAAVCASNIMMFSLANYLGASGDFESFFNWINFFAYLPVLLFVAVPFYRGLILSLKTRQISVDGPLAVASVVGFVFSTLNLWRGQGSIYFDSLSGFLFLILVGRFFQKRLQRRYLNFRLEIGNQNYGRVRKITAAGHWEWTVPEKLVAGDRIWIEKGEVIPADGTLISDQVQVDSSYISGESHPRLFLKDASLQAGGILLSAAAEIQVQAVGPKTLFGQLLQQIDAGLLKKTAVQQLSDKWSQLLLLTVFSVAITFLVMAWSWSPEQAMERSLALIILACPCAMAFGTPLALTFGMKKAFQNGILVRDGDVFEKVRRVQNVVFDKTGTLTGRRLFVSGHEVIRPHMAMFDLALALENQSQHPIAEAIRHYLGAFSGRPIQMENLREEFGVGVSGTNGGKRYEIRSSGNTEKSVTLYEDRAPIVTFYLQDPLQAGAQKLFLNLRKRGLGLYVFSGDSQTEVQKIALELGLDAENAVAEMTPFQKSEKILSLKKTMMVGDGFNDTLALQSSTVGVAIRSGVQMAMKSADVCLLSEDISKLDMLFDISKQTNAVIRRNLLISVFYNSLGGLAALLGFVNPLVAAILMPLSSGFILFSSWRGSRS